MAKKDSKEPAERRQITRDRRINSADRRNVEREEIESRRSEKPRRQRSDDDTNRE